MIKKIISIIFIILITVLTVIGISSRVRAQSCGNKEECQKLIEEYEKKLVDVRTQKNTLSSQISLMDTQINLTAIRIRDTEYAIEKTEEEILDLNDKIEGLDSSLDRLGKVLLGKIVEGYKRREPAFFNIFLDADNASVLMNRYKYAKITEENDRKLMFQVQQAKLNFEDQKEQREAKKIELDNLRQQLSAQRVDLANQKSAKQNLLSITQSDERTYQNLLAKAKAEFAAIQGIISGAGTETLLREVGKGETIASIISGASCNSSGSHLHFIIKEGGNVIDPFNKLKSVDNVNESNGDAFNPSGSWDWPISPTIYLHQGYGNTWFVRTYGWYSFHNGIDITGSSSSVVSVADGTLYRGSFSGFNGCALPYAKVIHKEGGIETFYLHVYVQ